MSAGKRAVILVGHGGIPSDFPKRDLAELKRLEGERQASGGPMGERERELDERVRSWPRTPETDPYKYGVEALLASLKAALPGVETAAAYNEFCGPSVEAAIEDLVGKGFERVTLVSIMLTPGGYHAEVEIPALVREARERHPGARIEYAWPYDLDAIAGFLKDHLAKFR